ncbi:Uncharacterized protein HZ326_16726, partial [Fusarium oxysporum f. sp. albedinis]
MEFFFTSSQPPVFISCHIRVQANWLLAYGAAEAERLPFRLTLELYNCGTEIAVYSTLTAVEAGEEEIIDWFAGSLTRAELNLISGRLCPPLT